MSGAFTEVPVAVVADAAVAPAPALAPDEEPAEEAEATWATWAALLIIEVAVEMALARLGRDEPLGGAKKLASGEEAAEARKLEAKLGDPDAVLTGRVWM